MMDMEGLLEVIASLYGTMLEDEAETHWMDVVRDCVGAEHAVLSEVTPATLSMHCSEIDDGMHPLARRLAFTTMYDPALASMPAKTAIRMSDHLPLRELLRTDVFHELVRPLHGGHALGFTWATGGGRSAIAICRDFDRARDFDDAELAVLQPVLLHVQNALRIRARLRALEASLAHAHAALDAMPEAAVIVDGARRVRYLNPAARQLAIEGDVRVDRGTLRAARARDDRALQELVDRVLGLARSVRAPRAAGDGAAAHDARMQIAIARMPPLRPLLVAAAPAAGVAARFGQGLAAEAAVLLLRDPDRLPQGSVESLGLAFDLTPREAELALVLAQGAPLARAAQLLGIGEGTARQYLKRVFAKTGVARQAELVGVLRNLC